MVNADFIGAPAFAGSFTAKHNASIAVVIKIAPKQRRARVTETSFFIDREGMFLCGKFLQQIKLHHTTKVVKILLMWGWTPLAFAAENGTHGRRRRDEKSVPDGAY
jgi:hypothetical protein